MAAKGSFSKYKSNGRRAFCEFQLNLKSFVVFGRGTLMLTFSLHVPKNGLDNEGDVIVVRRCRKLFIVKLMFSLLIVQVWNLSLALLFTVLMKRKGFMR